jgi:hypothetical protein
MPLDANQKIIFNALCKSICPNLKQVFVAEKKIKKELKFFMDVYTRAILETTPNDELITSLEKIMMDKIGTCGESKMYEAQYRIKMRSKLDSNPETFGKPIGPCSILFYIFEIERDDEKNEWKSFDNHPINAMLQMAFPWEKTSSEFFDKVKENIIVTTRRREKIMRVYIERNYMKRDKKIAYSTSELFQLGDDHEQIYSDSRQNLSEMVDMEQHNIKGIVLFF